MVAAGDQAPDFELPGRDGDPVRLSSLGRHARLHDPGDVIPKVSPKTHDEQVLGVLAEL